MMRQCLRRAAIGERLHRVFRIHVLVAHEPARLIGADRQDREPQRSVCFGDAAEMASVAITGIADDVEFAGRRLQHKTRPQRLVAVEQPARRPVPRRHQRHRDAIAELDAILPVKAFGFDRVVRIAHDEVIAERRDHPRRRFCSDPRQRQYIEMVVVAVRHQHDVDVRQGIEGNAGIVVAPRPRKAHRRDAHRPHGIDEDVEAAGLDQPARVAYERQPHLVALDARRRRVGMRVLHPIRPGRALAIAAELPAQHFTKSLRRHAIGVEEALPVKMIGDRALIGLHTGNPDRRHADESGGTGKKSKQATAGDGHGRDAVLKS